MENIVAVLRRKKDNCIFNICMVEGEKYLSMLKVDDGQVVNDSLVESHSLEEFISAIEDSGRFDVIR